MLSLLFEDGVCCMSTLYIYVVVFTLLVCMLRVISCEVVVVCGCVCRYPCSLVC